MAQICPHCGARLPDVWDDYCTSCGAELPPRSTLPTTDEPEPPPPDGPTPADAEQAALFWLALHTITPRVHMTRVLVAINVVVFAAMVVSGVSVTDPTPPDLVRWGALFGPFALDGQWWRLLTCCFIHIGVIHLLLNMWVLSTGGPVLERMVGNVGFLILYLISGLGGSLAALFWSPDVVAAGASGAVFGVFGALLGVLRKQRASIPRAALAGLKNFGVSFLMVNLVFGFMLPNISVSAHVGGAATGFLCGLVLSRPFTPEGVAGRPGQNVLTGVLGAVAIVLGAFLVSAMRPNFAEIHREMDRRDEVERRLRDIVNTAAGKVGRREMTDPEFARILERDVLPEWRATTDRLAAHGSLPGEMGKRVAAVIEYMRLQREAWELFVQAVREGDETTFARATEKQRLVDEAVKRLNSEKNR